MLRKPSMISISLILIVIVMVTAVCLLKNTPLSNISTGQNQLDYFAHNVIQKRYDQTGHVTSHSHSPYLFHIPKDNTIHSKLPLSTARSEKNTQWQLKADHAIEHKDTNITTFNGHVVITKPKTATQPAIIIRTDHAQYNNLTHIATTNALVTLDQGNNHQQGIGAIANFKQKTIKLLSQTRGHYAKS